MLGVSISEKGLKIQTLLFHHLESFYFSSFVEIHLDSVCITYKL